MLDYFRVDKIAFTALGYPLSYVEFVGTLLYLWSVWLVAKRKMLTWPVGIVSVLLYMVIFWQIRLYADTVEQIYYLAASAYGWWNWRQTASAGSPEHVVSFSPPRSAAIVLAVTAVVSIGFGALLTRVHDWSPEVFPEPASYPYLDAATTVMSFTAMLLLAVKRIENWFYWIVVDVAGIGLYYVKGVKFISLLYVLLLALAIKGAVHWIRARRSLPSPA